MGELTGRAVILSIVSAMALNPMPAAPERLAAPASAELCGRCHRAIYESWSKSAHATAMTSPIFLDAKDSAEQDFGVEARKTCLGCHAPMVGQLNDFELSRKVSWEGVTCDYCHSIREVRDDGKNPKAAVQFGSVKSGPSKDSISPAHGTAFSSVHTSAKLCAVCHEYRNSLGFPVITTYSEWKDSPSGKGDLECQQCHMELVKGAVVDPRVRRESSHRVNLHAMPGSHSVSQLDRALTAKLSAIRNGETIDVVVKVKNEGAGHDLPTGSPMRQLILEVRATAEGVTTDSARRTYTRVLADAGGAVIEKEHVAFMKAAKVVSDTRLAPDETRSETFSLAMPSSKPGRVDATFYYFHPATAGPEKSDRIKFLELSKSLP
jgi:cytochrome c554/c'-like protein